MKKRSLIIGGVIATVATVGLMARGWTIETGDGWPDFGLCGSDTEMECPMEDVTVVWTFQSDDCLRCQSFPQAIRAARAVVGAESIDFVAVHISEEPVGWIAEYFARSRLYPRRLRLSRSNFARLFGQSQISRLYIVHSDTVRAAFDLYPRPTVDSVKSRILALIPRSGEGSAPSITRSAIGR